MRVAVALALALPWAGCAEDSRCERLGAELQEALEAIEDAPASEFTERLAAMNAVNDEFKDAGCDD